MEFMAKIYIIFLIAVLGGYLVFSSGDLVDYFKTKRRKFSLVILASVLIGAIAAWLLPVVFPQDHLLLYRALVYIVNITLTVIALMLFYFHWRYSSKKLL